MPKFSYMKLVFYKAKLPKPDFNGNSRGQQSDCIHLIVSCRASENFLFPVDESLLL